MRGTLLRLLLLLVLGLALMVVLRLSHWHHILMRGGQGCVQASPTNGVYLRLQARGINGV